MSRTFYLSATNQATSVHAANAEKAALTTTGTDASYWLNGQAYSNTYFVWTSPAGGVGFAQWPTGTYTAVFDVNSASSYASYGCGTVVSGSGHFARVSTSSDLETKADPQSAFTGTGLKTASTGSVTWSAGNTTDLWEVLLTVYDNDVQNYTFFVELYIDGADDLTTGPWGDNDVVCSDNISVTDSVETEITETSFVSGSSYETENCSAVATIKAQRILTTNSLILGPQKKNYVQTTDITEALLLEVDVPPYCSVIAKVCIIGRCLTDYIYHSSRHSVINNGIVSATYNGQLESHETSLGAETWSISIACEGFKLKVNVIGEEDHNINWSGIVSFELSSKGNTFTPLDLAPTAWYRADHEIETTYTTFWKQIVDVVVNGTSVSKTAADAWGDGCLTGDYLDGDGAIEFRSDGWWQHRMIGLGTFADSGMEYGLYFLAGYPNRIYVYENSAGYGPFGSGSTEGATYRVQRTGTTVTYYQDDVLLYTSTAPSTTPIHGACCLYSQGASATDFVLTGDWQRAIPLEQVAYLKVSGNSVIKTTSDNWNAWAVSGQMLTGDGYVEYTLNATDKYKRFSLIQGSARRGSNVNFGTYIDGADGTIQIHELGSIVHDHTTVSVNDVIRIAVSAAGVVTYKKNGTTFYTSATTAAFPLALEILLYHLNDRLNNMVMSGTTAYKVTAWNDLSGNGHNAIQLADEQRPVYETAGFNGKPSLWFNGISESLLVPHASSLNVGTGNWFVAATTEFLRGTNYEAWFSKGTGSSADNIRVFRYPTSFVTAVHYGSDAQYYSAYSAGMAVGTKGVVGAGVVSNTEIQFMANSTLEATQAITPTGTGSNTQDLLIGRDDSGYYYTNFRITELVFLNRGATEVTEAELLLLLDYMKANSGT